LKYFCRRDSISPLFDVENAHAAGEIRALLELRDEPIGPYDTLIAAQARRRGARLVMRGLLWVELRA
jgi:predicted nucleic acid-binding protein